MNIQCLASSDAASLIDMSTGCLIVSVAEDSHVGSLLHALDVATGGLIERLRNSGELPVRSGETLMLHAPHGLKAERLLLVGRGRTDKTTPECVLAAARKAAAAWLTSRAESAIWAFDVDLPNVLPATRSLGLAVRALREADYTFDGYRSIDDSSARLTRRMQLVVSPEIEVLADEAIRVATSTANGVALARDLGNTPPNVCTPTHLAEAALAMSKQFDLDVEVFEREQIQEMGLGAFLAVARGSVEPPKLIVIRHQGGAPGQAPIALVGKGVTFDAGGISIKPSQAMDEMKYDMCGAASVLGAMLACAELALPINVVGVVVACENMPAGNALKPGDVVRSLSGKQIEVLNTDAEGRLILCDALTYVQNRFSPSMIVDIATLTGACIVALGSVHSGLYANSDVLAEALLLAGSQTCDSAWRMPLDDEYQQQLKSAVADVANDGGRGAGSVTAACFLKRFVSAPWAHLDIAGTAWRSGEKKGGTGRPVPLLAQFLINQASSECAA